MELCVNHAFLNLPTEIRLDIYQLVLGHIKAISVDKADKLTYASLPWLSTPDLEVRFDPRSSYETKALLMLMRTNKRILLEILELALTTKIVRSWNYDSLLYLRDHVGTALTSKIRHLDLFLWRVELLGQRIEPTPGGGEVFDCFRPGVSQLVTDARRDALIQFITACTKLITFRLDVRDNPIGAQHSHHFPRQMMLASLFYFFTPMVDAAMSIGSVRIVLHNEYPSRPPRRRTGFLIERQRWWAEMVDEEMVRVRKGEPKTGVKMACDWEGVGYVGNNRPLIM